jgi:hypothetical protein
MPGEFFFMSMGGLGMSLAGFGGLIAALTPKKEAASPVARWRITHIVTWGLQLTIVGFGVIVIQSIVEDAAMTARIASGAVVVIHLLRFRSNRPGAAFRSEAERKRSVGLTIGVILVVAPNMILGSVGYLHAIMLIMFAGPASIFSTGVKEIFTDPANEAEDTHP